MATSVEVTWAERVTELRDKAGLTLAEIGTLVGLSPSSVSDIEQGRTAEPSGNAALKLDALHRSKCSLMRSRRTG